MGLTVRGGCQISRYRGTPSSWAYCCVSVGEEVGEEASAAKEGVRESETCSFEAICHAWTTGMREMMTAMSPASVVASTMRRYPACQVKGRKRRLQRVRTASRRLYSEMRAAKDPRISLGAGTMSKRAPSR